MRVVKPRAFELKDLAKIPQLDWFGLSLDDAAGVFSPTPLEIDPTYTQPTHSLSHVPLVW